MEFIENLLEDNLTIEELFRDYKETPFESELIELIPTGNERW